MSNLHPPFEKGNKFGKGRKKGSLNKKTIERTEEFRKYLEENNFLCEMVKQIQEARAEGTLKPSEAAKALDVAAKYLIKTTAQDQDDEVIETLDRAAAEQMATRIAQRKAKLEPQTMEDEDL